MMATVKTLQNDIALMQSHQMFLQDDTQVLCLTHMSQLGPSLGGSRKGVHVCVSAAFPSLPRLMTLRCQGGVLMEN